MPPKPTILDFGLWVPRKAERCVTPDWWMELSAVPGKEDAQKVSQGGEGILRTPKVVAGIGIKEGQLSRHPLHCHASK